MPDFIVDGLTVLSGEFARRSPLAIVLVAGVALCIGSFLSVIVYRLPDMLDRMDDGPGGGEAAKGRANLVLPASHCRHCGRRIRWYENIPLLSYAVLRAKCAGCGARISPVYPAIEALACLAAVVAMLNFADFPRVLGAAVLSWTLICVSFIDVRGQVIPDVVVLPVLWLGLVCNAFNLFVPLRDAVFGAAAGYLILWCLYWIYRLTAGKEGMGYGDFKLLAMLGAWLGVKAVPVILMIGLTTGALTGLALMAFRGARLGSAVPFGPFLALGGWIALYWSTPILALYWKTLGGLGAW